MRKRHWSIWVGQIGFSLFLMGAVTIVVALLSPPPSSVRTQVAETPSATYAELQQLEPGAVRVIAGVISPENEVLFQGLVAYERARAVRDIRDQVVWVPEETRAPELLIALPGGSVTVEAEYLLLGARAEVIADAERYTGLTVGDPVLVLGTPSRDGPGVRVRAEYMLYGTRAENQPRHLDQARLAVGAGFAALGLAIMGWLLSRGYRPFGSYPTGR